MKFMIMRKQTLDMKESRITYNDLWEDLKEEEALADEKAGYPPKCNPGYEAVTPGCFSASEVSMLTIIA